VVIVKKVIHVSGQKRIRCPKFSGVWGIRRTNPTRDKQKTTKKFPGATNNRKEPTALHTHGLHTNNNAQYTNAMRSVTVSGPACCNRVEAALDPTDNCAARGYETSGADTRCAVLPQGAFLRVGL